MFSAFTLCIFDKLHLMTSAYEIVIQRIRFMSEDKKQKVRIVSMACPVANGKDLASWMGIDPDKGGYFNFSQAVRPQPLEV